MSDNPQPDVKSVIRYLSDKLGPELVGAMCGPETPALLKTWMVKPPNVEVENRLRMGYEVTRLLVNAEGADTARAWLMGMNPQLADENPLLEIGRDNGRNVLLAAKSYLEDPMLT